MYIKHRIKSDVHQAHNTLSCGLSTVYTIILTGKVEGKRDRDKQRITFLDSLCNSATGGQSKGLNFFKLSDDREVWRGMAANVCSRSGT